MNKEWSDLNKTFQQLIKKEATFRQGIETLLDLREQLIDVVLSFRKELNREEFNAMPFINADGYHSKTVAYSIWHIFRIEDIVAHTLINDDEQILFASDYMERIKAPLITTGNELVGKEIAEFSAQLVLDELYNYAIEVMTSTKAMLENLAFGELKNKISVQRKDKLMSLNVVSSDEKAAWLVDYWCGKDVGGLLPVSYTHLTLPTIYSV